MNFRSVVYFLGWVLKIEGFALIPPTLIALFSGEGSWVFLGAVLVFSLILGFIFSDKRFLGPFYIREGYTATALGWILFSVVGALPFWMSGKIPSYTDALFETVSGFTTTGASILTDIEALGKGLIFWRSLTHWIGGMGVLVLILAILPMSGAYHMQLMKAESPGPSVSKLVPRVADTAKTLYLIYLAMTVGMILLYLLSGMPLLDAVCIGFGTAGTGGFSIRNSGMADYNTVSQALITIFMILFGVNFNVYYLMLRKKWKDSFSSEEVLWYFGIVAAAILIFTLTGFFGLYHEQGLFYSFHHSAFTVASLISSTGFSTVDFALWPEFAQMLVLLIMFVGACAGSTGGGFKVSRMILLIKQAGKELHMLIHPEAVRIVKLEKKGVEHSVMRSVSSYLVIYVAIMLLSIFLLSLDGHDFKTNFSAVLACLNNIGPGLSKVGPTSNFAFFSGLSKYVLIFDMLAGRLELIPLVLILKRANWSKN